MFKLQIHSIDSAHQLPLDSAAFQSSAPRHQSSNPSLYAERRGVIYLYRRVCHSSLPNLNPGSRSVSVFVAAIPSYLSPADALRFFESLSPSDILPLNLLFLRNDAVEDRYSAVVEFDRQPKADAFYDSLNGKRFAHGEAELCHLLYVASLTFTDLGEIASVAPDGYTELPTCPICLERLDPDTSGVLTTLCDHSFKCSCISKWTSMSCQVCKLCIQQEDKPTCISCETLENLWICLICGFVGCGRYKEGHAINHWKDTKHCYSLDLTTQQIWDYVGDSYVHRLNQSKADGKTVDTNNNCASLHHECDTCDNEEDSGISDVIYSSKVEAIFDEYNLLLATQLETQRKHYENLILEAKSGHEFAVAEVVDEGINRKVMEIQNELETLEKEKNSLLNVNKNLMKEQEVMKKKFNEIEGRKYREIKDLDERIGEIEEQIRDIRVYIETQAKLKELSALEEIKEGTVLPVPSKPSPASGRRRPKSHGRNI